MRQRLAFLLVLTAIWENSQMDGLQVIHLSALTEPDLYIGFFKPVAGASCNIVTG
jgi:hypothetical protein